MSNSCHINAEDVILPLTGPATIAGCREMFAALLTGATLHLVDVEAVGLRAVRSRMRTEGATITYVVPTLLRALMAEEAADTFNSLRVVRIGGEKVAWTDIALLRKVVSNTCLVQVGYSSTELTGSQWFVPRSLPEYGASVPAGWLLPGIAFTIVNDEGRPVEPGESGELLIKSPHVLLGHWEGGAVLPAQSDPDDPGVRIFATGDLVQLDHLGLLRIVGRKGRQLKINGRRVEPAELEHVSCVARRPWKTRWQSQRRRTNWSRSSFPGTRPARRARTLRPNSAKSSRRSCRGRCGRCGFTRSPRCRVYRAERPMWRNSGRLICWPARRRQIRSPPTADASRRLISSCGMPGPGVPTSTKSREAGTKPVAISPKLLHCIMQIEGAIGHELSLEAFTVDMTAVEMADAIVSQGTTGRIARPKADAPPTLFLLPGSIGYGPSMAAFATAIRAVARVTPIKYPDLKSILGGKNTVASMADAAVEQIQRSQSVGDIRLLGHSLGGAVGFEVAARLLEAGRVVKFLGILDTSIVNERRDYRETFARVVRRVRTNRINVSRVACRALAKVTCAIGCEARLAWILDRYSRRKFDATCFRIKLELQEVLRSRAFFQWLASPKPAVPINATLFRCDREGVPQSLGWDRSFASLDVIPIAGNHIDLVVEPHLTKNRPLIEKAISQTCASAGYRELETP